LFSQQLKELIARSQANDWKARYESSESLFELIKTHGDSVNKMANMVETADCLCKLINDPNAKI